MSQVRVLPPLPRAVGALRVRSVCRVLGYRPARGACGPCTSQGRGSLEARNLTPAQRQAKLARAEKLIDRLVNAKLTGKRGGAAKARVLRVSARYIEIEPQALRAELKGGKSLAQVATAHGKTTAGLKAALLAAAKTRLDKAVSAGRVTSPQAQTRLDRLSMRLDKLITKTR